MQDASDFWTRTTVNSTIGCRSQSGKITTSRMHDVTLLHAPIFVFMRGITRRYDKTVHDENCTPCAVSASYGTGTPHTGS